jgi:hypothetical protein
MLPANLEEHTSCLYAFAPIPSTESNSDIPFPIASIAAPSPRTKSAYWECLQRVCPNSNIRITLGSQFLHLTNNPKLTGNRIQTNESHFRKRTGARSSRCEPEPQSPVTPKTKAPQTRLSRGTLVNSPPPKPAQSKGGLLCRQGEWLFRARRALLG